VTSDIAVRLKGVGKSFGPVTAVHPFDLEIRRGDFLAILGPSGCGKTTLLRMIGGFVEPSSGRIEVDGADVTELGPERRPTNMVFQGYGLFPHMNVRQNVGYGLKLKKLPAEEVARRVGEAMALVRLEEYGERAATELSGGQQQRVALARALVMEPRVLLLDEPLAALDLKLRQAMQEELRRIHRAIGGTFVFVTHDQGEALALANRIAVMNEGRVEQLGAPEEIYFAPASRFVAGFIGEANLLKARRSGGRIGAACGIEFASPGADGGVAIVIRPEAVRPLTNGVGADLTVTGIIEEVVFLGTHNKYVLALPNGEKLTAQDRPQAPRSEVGQLLRVGWTQAEQRVIEDRG
jgi:ABC-type Fe3+/spermidine/putrescine transport system ATPase subunit